MPDAESADRSLVSGRFGRAGPRRRARAARYRADGGMPPVLPLHREPVKPDSPHLPECRRWLHAQKLRLLRPELCIPPLPTVGKRRAERPIGCRSQWLASCSWRLNRRYEKLFAFLQPSVRLRYRRKSRPDSERLAGAKDVRNVGIKTRARSQACPLREFDSQDGNYSAKRAIAHAPATSAWGRSGPCVCLRARSVEKQSLYRRQTLAPEASFFRHGKHTVEPALPDPRAHLFAEWSRCW